MEYVVLFKEGFKGNFVPLNIYNLMTNQNFSNTKKSSKTRKSIYTGKNGKTKKNKSLFGGSNCEEFLINFEVSIGVIKKMISDKGDKKF